MSGVQRVTLLTNLLLLLIAGSLVLGSLVYDFRQHIVPLIIGIPTILLLIFLLLGTFFPRLARIAEGATLGDMSDTESVEGDAGRHDNWPRIIRIASWMVALAGSLFIFGFFLAVPVFLILFFTLESKLPLYKAAAATAAVSLVMYLMFLYFLNIEIWPGSIPEIIEEYLGGGRVPEL
jgi:hypothetical protein